MNILLTLDTGSPLTFLFFGSGFCLIDCLLLLLFSYKKWFRSGFWFLLRVLVFPQSPTLSLVEVSFMIKPCLFCAGNKVRIFPNFLPRAGPLRGTYKNMKWLLFSRLKSVQSHLNSPSLTTHPSPSPSQQPLSFGGIQHQRKQCFKLKHQWARA